MNFTVLQRYHHQIEEALRIEVEILRRELNEAQECVGRLQKASDRDTQRFVAQTYEGVSSHEMVSRYAEFDGAMTTIRQAQHRLAKAGQRWNDKMAEVLKAAQESRRFDLLAEQQAKREQTQELRREQQLMDEAAARRMQDRA
jgi:flagellar export protein FliJ